MLRFSIFSRFFFFFFSKFSSQQQLKRFLHFSLLLWVSPAKTTEIFQKTPNSILFWLSKATNNGPHGGNVECVHFAIWRKEREIQKFVLNLTQKTQFQSFPTEKFRIAIYSQHSQKLIQRMIGPQRRKTVPFRRCHSDKLGHSVDSCLSSHGFLVHTG